MMADKGGVKLSLVEGLKIAVLGLGVISIVVGYHGIYDFGSLPTMASDLFKELCSRVDECPGGCITMEFIFLILIPIFLLLSFINLILSLIIRDFNNSPIPTTDMIYHFVGGFFVLVGGVLIIASSIRIDSFVVEWAILKEKSSCSHHPSPISNDPKETMYRISCSCYHTDIDPSKQILQDLVNEVTGALYCQYITLISADSIKDPNKLKNLLGSDTQSGRIANFRTLAKFHEKNAAGVIAIINGLLYIGIGVLILMKGSGGGGKVSPGRGGFDTIYPPPPQGPYDNQMGNEAQEGGGQQQQQQGMNEGGNNLPPQMTGHAEAELLGPPEVESLATNMESTPSKHHHHHKKKSNRKLKQSR